MTDSDRTQEWSTEEKVIFGAGLLYLAAFVLISTTFSMGTLEIVLLLLVLAVLGSLVYQRVQGLARRIHGVLTVGYALVGGLIAIRYALHFVTDRTNLSVLLLFLAVAGLGWASVAILVRLARRAADGAGSEGERAPGEERAPAGGDPRF